MIKSIIHVAFLGLFWMGNSVANAGAINHNVWYQFSWDTSTSVLARGCDPADTLGLMCASSSGTPTVFADAPAWTFTVGSGGVTLVLTDAFYTGDSFEVFNSGSSIGITPSVSPYDDTLNPIDCGDDPEACLATSGMSYGSFILGAGNYSLTTSVLVSPLEAGSAYFTVKSANVIPSPGVLALMLPGMFGLWLTRRKVGGGS